MNGFRRDAGRVTTETGAEHAGKSPYLVILDNSLRREPLQQGLPYYQWATAALPGEATWDQFVEDVLYYSELWANVVPAGPWIRVQLVDVVYVCRRCGRLHLRLRPGPKEVIHAHWFIAAAGDGWFAQYRAHRAAGCELLHGSAPHLPGKGGAAAAGRGES